MYQIKQKPSDFIVDEIPDVEFLSGGKYTYFLLKKTNYNTVDAVVHVARALKVDPKKLGFAGNKDRNAVTSQVVSVEGNFSEKLKNVSLKDIGIEVLGHGDERVYLGRLKGNKFEITVRNIDDEDVEYLKKKGSEVYLTNYFGEQRFSKNNAEIGREIIRKDFKAAVELILENTGSHEELVKRHLSKSPNDFIGAMREIPKKILTMYINAYQSLLWNRCVDLFVDKNGLVDVEIPIIGFSTELDEFEWKVQEVVEEVMTEEKVGFRDFIIKQMPDLSSAGSSRETKLCVDDFSVLDSGEDELNVGKKKVVVKFSLPKGSYATVLLEVLFD